MREAVPHAMFLDLHKAYDTFYRFRFLEILEGYGVGTRALRLLWRYWERLHVVARWWEVTTENPSTEREASRRGIPCRPQYSMWRTTASTTTLNIVGDRGYPCVTPLSPCKGSPDLHTADT